jgi:hypothetical protein
MSVVKRFSEPERRVWEAFPEGKLVDFSASERGVGAAAGPGVGDDDRRIRAEVVAQLLCGAVRAHPGYPAKVLLRGAFIDGILDLHAADVEHILWLERCEVPEGLDLAWATSRMLVLQRCRLGPVRLMQGSIGGHLDLSGSCLDGRGGPSIDAVGVAVRGDMLCRDGFRAEGTIRLVGGNIGGHFDLEGAYLAGGGSRALDADELAVAGDMYCHNGLHAEGEISIVGTGIDGHFDLSGAELDGLGGPALSADRLKVTSAMFCREPFTSRGEVRMTRARLGGPFDLSGARLDGCGGPALTADGLTVEGDMSCQGNFQTTGAVSLVGAQIQGQLSFSGAHLNDGSWPILNAEMLSVARGLLFLNGFRAKSGINLARANIGALNDDKDSWPDRLDLNGLTYNDLLPHLPARDRLDWLGRSKEYHDQPYERLAAYYRRLGRDREARRTLLTKERIRMLQRPWWTRWWGWLQDGLVGYGYAPGRAVVLLTLVFVGGWLFYTSNNPAPADPIIHPTFNPALYTLDLLIPAPGIGQISDWDPHGVTLAVAVGLRFIGWLLTITVIAAITRTLTRE